MSDKQAKIRKTSQAQIQLRVDAESKLASTTIVNLANATAAEKVLHELQVHKLELEMQNEELRKAHLALEESRDRYLDLFEFAPIGYFTLTSSGIIAEVNFIGAKLLGYQRGAMMLRPFSKYISPEFCDQFHLSLVRLVQEDVPQTYGMQIEREDRTKIFVHVDAMCVKKEDGTTMIRMTLTDITKHKKSEDALRIMATAFEAQEGIMITDEHNRIIRVNHAFCRLTGYSAAEVLGKNASIISSWEHDSDFFKSVFETISRDKHWQGEIWNQRKNREIFPSIMTITAVIDSQGRTTNFVGSFLDITLQKHADNVIEDARQQLEQKIEDIATELAAVKGDSENLNTALKVITKMRSTESFEVKNTLKEELNQRVLPFLQSLKNDNEDQTQLTLINTLEKNLQQLILSYGNPSTIASLYRSLTPKEMQVAKMVRDGVSTKEIAASLSLSEETIGVHRKNIRKKLGLGNNGENLRSYLMTT